MAKNYKIFAILKGFNMEYKIDKATSETISITKFIAIIFVVFSHSYRDTVNFVGNTVELNIPLWFDIIQFSISQIITITAVPIFFFFSSILLYKNCFSFKNNIIKKFHTLLIPYLIFNTIAILSYYILQGIPQLSTFFTDYERMIRNWHFMDWLNAYIGYRIGFPLLYPLWFIRYLFILNIFAKFIELLEEKYNKVIIVLLFSLYCINGWLIKDHGLRLYIISIFYWYLGLLFVKKQIKLESIKIFVKKYHLFLIYIIGVICCYLMHYYNLHSGIVGNITTIIGCTCLISAVYCIKSNKIKDNLLKISVYTFPIYLIHEFNLTFFRKALSAILPNNIVFVSLEYILCPIIISLYCIFIAIIIKNKSPKIYSIIFGNR